MYRALALAALAASASGITTVHVVPHSHEDPGWLLTSDQYYEEKSKAIITNVVASLEANASRVFHYVEQVYFRRWWLANPAKHAAVRRLVAEKRLMFMTGGLCMNDEATTHHGAVIDQMSWGWRFLNATFGPAALPTVGWQIDTFGHSAGYSRLTVDMGLSTFIGQKVDFQEQRARAANDTQQLEFEWTPDKLSAPDAKLFAHLMWDNTRGYSFVLKETVCKNGTHPPNMPAWWQCTTTPLRSTNCTGGPPAGNGCCRKTCGDNCSSCAVELGAADVVAHVRGMIPRYKHGQKDLFMAHGSDFQWMDAPKPYEAMEQIMAYVNARPVTYGLKLIYSSPAKYFAAIKAHEQRERVREQGGSGGSGGAAVGKYDGDFLPAAFSAHYVRSGFYSSRPASKGLDRAVWGRGDAAKRLRVLASAAPATEGKSRRVAALDAAVAAVDASVGVHQHHDAMSGTDLVAVADNYRQMMIAADELALPASAAAAAALAGAPALADSFAACVQSNVSVCAATAPLQQGTALTLVLFNPLGSARSDVVAIPIPVAGVAVSSAARTVASEVHEALFVERAHADARNYTLFVNVSLAPLETLELLLTPAKVKDAELVRFHQSATGADVALSAPGGATASVDGLTGALSSIGGRPVASTFAYYVPNAGSNHSHGYSDGGACSSAYAFLPQHGGTKPYPTIQQNHAVRSAKGKLVQQTHAVVDAKAGVELAVRVVAGDASVRLLAKLGPLDILNGFGQEAVIILDACKKSTSKTSAGACAFGRSWWTDANALQMVERTWRDNSTKPTTAVGTRYLVWEPEAQNYYPATAMAALRSSSSSGGALTVAFNAAHGVTSRSAGALELMLHRRIVDHGCRTDQGYQMNDVHPVISELRVQAPSDEAKAAAAYRVDALNVLHPLSAYFGLAGGETSQRLLARQAPGALREAAAAASAAKYALPANVHLHTLRALGADLEEAQQRCDPFSSLASCADGIARARAAAGAETREAPQELIVRFQHLYAVGEDGALSRPATVNMSSFFASVLPSLKVASAAETTLVAAKVLKQLSGAEQAAITLMPLQIRTFLVKQ